MIETGFTVDWIAATVKKDGEYNTLMRFLTRDFSLANVEGVPPKGYTGAHEYENGLVIAWNANRDDMGWHIRLSGSVLRWYQARDISWHDILFAIKRAGGRTSRVDLAVDVRNSGLTLALLCKPNLQPYKGKGRTPKYLPVGTQEDGWTVYVGSRSSQKYLRVYDKAKEMGNHTDDYIRIELECKEETAHAIGHEFPNMTIADCANMARTLIRTVAEWQLPAWREAMESELITLTLPDGAARDTMGWLIKSCAPALAKEIAKRPSEDVLGEFMRKLEQELRERGISLE